MGIELLCLLLLLYYLHKLLPLPQKVYCDRRVPETWILLQNSYKIDRNRYDFLLTLLMVSKPIMVPTRTIIKNAATYQLNIISATANREDNYGEYG